MAVKETILKSEHVRLGGRMVDFAGWYLPVEFAGLRAEHENVRKNVGLFDVSHMGEIRVTGPNAVATLEWLTTNSVAKLGDGQAQYTLLPNEQGGLVDDLIIYCIEKNQNYLLCVNASNTTKDLAWILKNNKGAEIRDESAEWSQIAVQGPKATELCGRVFGHDVARILAFQIGSRTFNGGACWLARTGYTGEDGFEIFVPNAQAVALWRELLAKGEDLGVQPIGLGARDTLRTEMKYSLYGHEITDATNPYEAGLGWVVKPEAKDFIGKDAMLAAKQAGIKRKLVGFKMLERGIPRQDYRLFSFDNKEIGSVTSGTVSPTLGDNIGIGYVTVDQSEVGNEILVEIRGKKLKAQVVKTPFVNKVNKKGT